MLEGWWRFFFIPGKEDFDIAELFVGDAHDGNLSGFGQHTFDALDMYFSIFTAWAMADIHGELKQRKTVIDQRLAEAVGVPHVGFGLRREIVQYYYPHNPVCVKPFGVHILNGEIYIVKSKNESGSSDQSGISDQPLFSCVTFIQR